MDQKPHNVMCFSSNGLFEGKTVEELKKIMIEEDRFEWKSIVVVIRGGQGISKLFI